jgi:hypothetical protein
VPRDLTYLRETEACLAQHRYSAICTESTAQIDAWTSTPDQVRRDTRLATGGLLTIIVGLGAVARWRLGRKRPSHVLSIPLALWVAGEGLVAAAGLVALALFVGLVVVQLSEGVPFNLDTLDRAAHAVLALITTMSGLA